MTLKIFNSSITDFSNIIINKGIVSLFVNHCDLETIKINSTLNITLINLRHLDFSHNSLYEFSLHAFTAFGVQRLILSNNNFTKIPNLSSFHNLKYLDLSYNQITEIFNGTLQANQLLEYIDLSHNMLEFMRPSDFGRNVTVVDLDANPWRCDCHLRDLIRFQNETLISKSFECYNPPSLRGINWRYLKTQDFICGPIIEEPQTEIVYLEEDESLSLTCRAWGHPLPVILWKSHISTSETKIDSAKEALQNGWINSQLNVRYNASMNDETFTCHVVIDSHEAVKTFIVQMIYKNDSYVISRPTETEHKATDSNQEKRDLSSTSIIVFLSAPFTMIIIVYAIVACRRRYETLPKTVIEHQLTKESKHSDQSHLVGFISSEDEHGEYSWINDQSIKPRNDMNEIEPTLISTTDGINIYKAPLAQYDRDTNILPIIQTSL